MADDDSGESFMARHMNEGQTSSGYGSMRDQGNSNLRDRQRNYRGDQYYDQRYGKSTDMSPGEDQSVNRGAKGDRR